jgi:hypothetical protein
MRFALLLVLGAFLAGLLPILTVWLISVLGS